MRRRIALVSLLVAVSACSSKESEPPAPVPPELMTQVLDEVPSDVPNRTFIDFGGKVHLVGWNVEPKGVVGPGQSLKLTMYWRSVAPLSPGWSLFTHMINGAGARVENVDNVGPLRARMGDGPQALPPSAWVPGKVYVDEQEITMPRDVKDAELTLVVGIWKGSARLPVISGPADREQRAIIAHVKTGVVPAPPATPASPAEK